MNNAYLNNMELRRWTQSAIECYRIGCNCELCPLSIYLETKCYMKKTVLRLVRKFGKPKEVNRCDFIKEEN